MLEAQFAALLSKISSTHDFEHIRLAHDKFIATLQAQLLLANNAVSPTPFNSPPPPPGGGGTGRETGGMGGPNTREGHNVMSGGV